MSAHEVLVVKIESVTPHPNADSLDLIKISGYDYSVIARRGDYSIGDLAVFIEPDYVVPTNIAEFAFLGDNGRKSNIRITTRRLRGLWSDGLLIKARPHHNLGDNVIEEYNIIRWEPPPPKNSRGWGNEGSDLQGGWCAPGPNITAPKYDLENLKKYSGLITPNDTVFYTVKIHGCNGRFVYVDGKMYCGSRTTWKYEPGTIVTHTNTRTGEVIEKIAPENSWWNALKQNPWIEEFCRNNPNIVLYGEVFGADIQGTKFHYGYPNGKLGVRIFDALKNGQWVSFNDLYTRFEYKDLKLVPVLYFGPHDLKMLDHLVEANEDRFEGCGDNHIREGVVIKLMHERFDQKIGRVALKYVSRNYLTRS